MRTIQQFTGLISLLFFCTMCTQKESELKISPFTAKLAGISETVNGKPESLKIYEKNYSFWSLLATNSAQRERSSALDLMQADDFLLLEDRTFAIFTNHSGKDKNLTQNLELLVKAGKIPEFIYSPEHGFLGEVDTSNLGVSKQQATRREARYQIPIIPLYNGKNRKPQKADLQKIDTIVVDIVNLPVRCYTYNTTLYYLLEQAQENNITIMILDRYNPYQRLAMAGKFLDPDYQSFIGQVYVPFLFNLSNAEFALYLKKKEFPDLQLEIIKGDNFNREFNIFENSKWINPSPNIPSEETALVYSGMVLFEGINYSVGRGTVRPFIYSGAPWVSEPWHLVDDLKSLGLTATLFTNISFIPSFSQYKGEVNHGVQISLLPENKTEYEPIRIAYEYMSILYKRYPNSFEFIGNAKQGFLIDRLWGGSDWRKAITNRLSYQEFSRSWKKDIQDFKNELDGLRLYQ